jgi:hypothetical protein
MDIDEIFEELQYYNDDTGLEEAINELSEIIYYSNAVDQIGINNLNSVIESYIEEFGAYGGIESIASWNRANEYRDAINSEFNDFPNTVGELREMVQE